MLPILLVVFVWIQAYIRCWAIKDLKQIKYTIGSKAKINIGEYYAENEEFYIYDLGITYNIDSFLQIITLENLDKPLNFIICL